jgi:hypothetical protein
MVLSIRRELRKGLSTFKVPKVLTPLNAIAVQRECDIVATLALGSRPRQRPARVKAKREA